MKGQQLRRLKSLWNPDCFATLWSFDSPYNASPAHHNPLRHHFVCMLHFFSTVLHPKPSSCSSKVSKPQNSKRRPIKELIAGWALSLDHKNDTCSIKETRDAYLVCKISSSIWRFVRRNDRERKLCLAPSYWRLSTVCWSVTSPWRRRPTIDPRGASDFLLLAACSVLRAQCSDPRA